MLTPATWNVMVIDNEPDSIRIIEMVCRHHGAKVRSALSGSDGLACIAQEMPGILFLDIQMPVMTGWDVLKVIRGNPDWSEMIVIAMTAHAMGGDRERILGVGFDGYFPKPVSPLSLIRSVQTILEERQHA